MSPASFIVNDSNAATLLNFSKRKFPFFHMKTQNKQTVKVSRYIDKNIGNFLKFRIKITSNYRSESNEY